MLRTNSRALTSSHGRPDIGAQWSKKFWGNAVPWVFSLSRVENPKVSATGTYALTTCMGLPSTFMVSTISPLLELRVLYTPPKAVSGAVISQRNMGSRRVGLDASWRPWKSLLAAGSIWPPPLWAGSWWTWTSVMLKRQPLMLSSASTPAFAANWKEEQSESLISWRYWAPLTVSTRTLAPSLSGPKHHIFKASVLSQSNSLNNLSALILMSPFGSIYWLSII